MSIDRFAEEVRIHHTTLRQWLKKYAPDFYSSRKIPSQQINVQPPIDSMPDTKSTSVQIEAEWYQHEQMEFSHSPATGRDPESEDRVAKLLDEIAFLRQQVAYWMQQESVRL